MKFFKLFENWDGYELNESSSQSDLIQSIIADQPTEFASAVENVFAGKGEKISVEYTNEKTGEKESIDIEPVALSKGSKNTFTDVDSTDKDIEKYAKDFGKLILTFAGKTRKIRTPYGERICQLGTSNGFSRGKLNKGYLDKIYTLALCSEIPTAALCLIPRWSGWIFLLVTGSVQRAAHIRLSKITTAPSCKTLLLVKIDSRSE